MRACAVAVLAAALAASSTARAQEATVWLAASPDDPLARRISQELRALGHPVLVAPTPATAAVVVRLGAGSPVRATVTAEGAAPVTLALDASDDGAIEVAAVRVVEAVRAILLPRPRPPRALPAPPPRSAWWEQLRGSIGAGLLASPVDVAAQPTVHLRAAWEGAVWIEVASEIGVAAASAGEASLRVSTVAAGAGAGLLRGAAGALGLTLRGGVAVCEAGGVDAATGVVGIAAGAVRGRVRVWRRLAVDGELVVGTTLAPVRVRSEGRVIAEWGRPFLGAALALSF